MRHAPGAIIRPILLVVGAAAVTACGRPPYCEIKCRCYPDDQCFQATLLLCETEARGDELASQQLGCSEQYDALATCRDETALCSKSDGMVVTSCDVQQDVWTKCLMAAQAK